MVLGVRFRLRSQGVGLGHFRLLKLWARTRCSCLLLEEARIAELLQRPYHKKP